MSIEAVIKTGGKQHVVKEGDTLLVELVGDQKKLTLTPLLVTKDGKPVSAKSAKVAASVLETVPGEKLVVFKMKAKKGYRRKAGHRQRYSQLKIDKITV